MNQIHFQSPFPLSSATTVLCVMRAIPSAVCHRTPPDAEDVHPSPTSISPSIHVCGRHDYCLLIYCYALPVIRASAPVGQEERNKFSDCSFLFACFIEWCRASDERRSGEFMRTSPLRPHSSPRLNADDDGMLVMMIRETE